MGALRSERCDVSFREKASGKDTRGRPQLGKGHRRTRCGRCPGTRLPYRADSYSRSLYQGAPPRSHHAKRTRSGRTPLSTKLTDSAAA